jgi:hypothetical protein
MKLSEKKIYRNTRHSTRGHLKGEATICAPFASTVTLKDEMERSQKGGYLTAGRATAFF